MVPSCKTLVALKARNGRVNGNSISRAEGLYGRTDRFHNAGSFVTHRVRILHNLGSDLTGLVVVDIRPTDPDDLHSD